MENTRQKIDKNDIHNPEIWETHFESSMNPTPAGEGRSTMFQLV